MGFLDGSDGKELACNTGNSASFPGLGRSSGEGNGYPLYSCLKNSMNREPGGLQSMRSQGIRRDRVTNNFTFTFNVFKLVYPLRPKANP